METVNFIIEISIPLLLGLAVSRYLKSVTASLLLDLCGTQVRSDFWVHITTILMTSIPLVLALTFGHSGNAGVETADVARHALLMSIFGIVISVGVMARMIIARIPRTVVAPESMEASQ